MRIGILMRFFWGDYSRCVFRTEMFQVYRKRYPESATKIVIWKRYNDFKKLHKELKIRHQKLHLGDKFPPFVKAKFFKR